jgi:hypothetical protein
MDKYRYGGKCATIAAAAMLLSLAALPARAQAPGGSYLETCTHVRPFGDRLIADCRRMDGAWNRTALHDFDSCVGGIANMDGQLTCNHARRDYGARDHRWDGYGSSGGYGPGRSGDYYGR